MPKVREITAPSGKVYKWTRPPRHVHWRHGRTAQTFLSRIEEFATGELSDLSADDKGLRLLESLSSEEATQLEAYVNDVLAAGLQCSVDDLDMNGLDYWYLYGQAVYAVPEAVVETEEGDTTVAAVAAFPGQPSVPDAPAGMSEVPTAPSEGDGDSRSAAA